MDTLIPTNTMEIVGSRGLAEVRGNDGGQNWGLVANMRSGGSGETGRGIREENLNVGIQEKSPFDPDWGRGFPIWMGSYLGGGASHPPLLNTDWLNITRTQDVHICWLRRKLLTAPKTIVDAYRVMTTFPFLCPFSTYL